MVASSVSVGQRALTTQLPAANEERRYVEDYQPRPAAIRQGLAVLKVTKVRAYCVWRVLCVRGVFSVSRSRTLGS